MRKSHLVALCRFWGYRCDLWQRKTELLRKRKFKAVDAPPPAASGALVVALPGVPATATAPTDDAGLRTLVAHQFGALLRSSTRAIAGDDARAAVETHNTVAFYTNCLTEYANTAKVLRSMARSWHITLQRQRAWSMAAASAAANNAHRERDPALWTLTPFLDTDAPVERSLAAMQSGLVVAHRMWRAGVAQETAQCPLLLLPLVLSVAIAEFERAVMDALQFKAQASQLLARLRADAPLRAYFVAVELLAVECAQYCTNAADAYEERAKWTTEVMRRGLKGRLLLTTISHDNDKQPATLMSDTAVAEIQRLANSITAVDG